MEDGNAQEGGQKDTDFVNEGERMGRNLGLRAGGEVRWACYS